jgi:hypothetical protein
MSTPDNFRRRALAWILCGVTFVLLSMLYVNCQFTQRRLEFAGDNLATLAIRTHYGWPFVWLNTTESGAPAFFSSEMEKTRILYPAALAANSFICLILSFCMTLVAFRIARRIEWPVRYRLFSLGEFVLAVAIVLAAIRVQPELINMAQLLGFEPGYPLHLGLYQTITLLACGCTAYVSARVLLALLRRIFLRSLPSNARRAQTEGPLQP